MTKTKTDRLGIKNYTTQISSEKTIVEIETLLAKHGAIKILKDYDENGVNAISFMIRFKEQYIPIQLPTHIDKVLSILNDKVNKKEIPRKFYNNKEQARRIMWRILLDWLDAQMTMIAIGQKDLLEIFLSDVCEINGSSTLYQKMMNTGFKGYLLEAPKK